MPGLMPWHPCHVTISVGATKTSYTTLDLCMLPCCHHIALHGTLASLSLQWQCKDILCHLACHYCCHAPTLLLWHPCHAISVITAVSCTAHSVIGRPNVAPNDANDTSMASARTCYTSLMSSSLLCCCIVIRAPLLCHLHHHHSVLHCSLYHWWA